jgi:hypothetical protein
MAISRRYPEKPPLEQVALAIDLSPILPPGVGLVYATIDPYTNTNPALLATDMSLTEPSVRGRYAEAWATGGTAGADYQIRWHLTDSQGNVWTRTALLLCAETS